jgi:hypothetical protein
VPTQRGDPYILLAFSTRSFVCQDANGRVAVDVASKPMKEIVQSVLLWYGRYRLTESRPRHFSDSSYVFPAADERTVDADTGQPAKVALKLMRCVRPFLPPTAHLPLAVIPFDPSTPPTRASDDHRSKAQFERELTVRKRGLHSDYVVGVLHAHPRLGSSALGARPDLVEAAGTEEEVMGTLAKEHAERLFLLVLPLADTTLWVTLKQVPACPPPLVCSPFTPDHSPQFERPGRAPVLTMPSRLFTMQCCWCCIHRSVGPGRTCTRCGTCSRSWCAAWSTCTTTARCTATSR